MATDSSTLAGKLPWTEEPGREWSIGSHSQTDYVTEHTHTLKNTVKPQIYWTAFKSHYLFSLIFVKTHHFPQYVTLIFKQMPLSTNGRNQLKIEYSCM